MSAYCLSSSRSLSARRASFAISEARRAALASDWRDFWRAWERDLSAAASEAQERRREEKSWERGEWLEGGENSFDSEERRFTLRGVKGEEGALEDATLERKLELDKEDLSGEEIE